MFRLPFLRPLDLLTPALAALLIGCGGGQADVKERSVRSDDTRRFVLASNDAVSSPLFAYAERAYASLFPPGAATQTAPPYTYRYYPATGNYLGLADGHEPVSALSPSR